MPLKGHNGCKISAFRQHVRFALFHMGCCMSHAFLYMSPKGRQKNKISHETANKPFATKTNEGVKKKS